MYLPKVNHSSSSLLLYSHYAILRLGYEDPLLDQRAIAVSARDRFQAAVEVSTQARLAANAARATRDYQDARLDKQLREFRYVIRTRCGFDRSVVRCTVYFPDGPTGIVRVRRVRELRLVGSNPNLLPTEPDAEIRAFEPRLCQAYDNAVAARAACIAAEEHELTVSKSLRREKVILIETFRRIHLVVSRRLGERRAESFFRGARRSAKSLPAESNTTPAEEAGASIPDATPALTDATTRTDNAA